MVSAASGDGVEAPRGRPYLPGELWWDKDGDLWVILDDGTALWVNVRRGELTEARNPRKCRLKEQARAPLHATARALLANR